MSTLAPIQQNEATRTAAANAARTAAALAEVTKKNQALGKDDFLKLLLAQLKNQDPQDPADSAQMAAQLAQFTSVEQLTNISKSLDAQGNAATNLLNEVSAGTAVNTIGKTVTATSDLVELDGSGNESLVITGNGGPAKLNVYDAVTGAIVTSRDMGSLAAGTSEIVIGRALSGLSPGVYRVAVTNVDANDTSAWTTAVRGTVTGIETSSSGLQYALGRLRVPLNSISAISTR
jgi:flagellar basal-body rod modification protein FlgD